MTKWNSETAVYRDLRQKYIIDSRAPLQVMEASSLTQEFKAVTKFDDPCLIMTANGTVETHEETTVYIKDFDDDSPAVLSLRGDGLLTLPEDKNAAISNQRRNPTGRSNQTSARSRKCRKRLHARLVKNLSQKAELKNHLRLSQCNGTLRTTQNQKVILLQNSQCRENITGSLTFPKMPIVNFAT